MSGDLELRLQRALSVIEEPAADVEPRLRAAALAALPSRPVSRRGRLGPVSWRRRIGPLVVAAALVAAGAALAASLFHWDAGSTGRRGAFVSDTAARRFAATPALDGAPWLTGGAQQTMREVPLRPSLVFPAGTGYAAALQRFYDAVSREGGLPTGTRLGAPLPAGRVVSLPAGPGDPLRLDLRAPFGYLVPSGTILGPHYTLGKAAVTFPAAGAAGTPLPVGVTVVAPRLLACQTMRGDRAGPACPASALPPGARYSAGSISVSTFVGEQLPDALAAAQASGLGLFAHVGYLPALSDGALARAGDPTGGGSLISLEDFVRSGYAAPGLYGTPGRAGVRLSATESRPAGTVVGQFPPAGTLVPRGTPIVLAVVADDCLLTRSDAGPWDCVPGSARSRQADPALSGVLPWLSRGADGALMRLSDSRARPSLTFPAGTTYLQALKGLLVSVVEGGRVPQGSALGPPLDRGVVLESPSHGHGPVIDLRAPFGYDPVTGRIAQPPTAAMASVSGRRLRSALRAGRAALLSATFAGDYLIRPSLAACQVSRAGRVGPRCRAAR